MNVLGLDLSIRSTGWAVVTQDPSNQTGLRYHTGKVVTESGLSLPDTCAYQFVVLYSYIQSADFVVYESQIAVRGHNRGNSDLGKIHGAISVAIALLNKPYIQVAPIQLRSWAHMPRGSGKIGARLGLKMSSDEADALFLATIGCHKLGIITGDAYQTKLVGRLDICHPRPLPKL